MYEQFGNCGFFSISLSQTWRMTTDHCLFVGTRVDGTNQFNVAECKQTQSTSTRSILIIMPKMEADPFPGLKISSSDWLDRIEERSICARCHRSRKYFCYTCFFPVGEVAGKLPRVEVSVECISSFSSSCLILRLTTVTYSWICLKGIVWLSGVYVYINK